MEFGNKKSYFDARLKKLACSINLGEPCKQMDKPLARNVVGDEE
jgi:hypothetical protein